MNVFSFLFINILLLVSVISSLSQNLSFQKQNEFLDKEWSTEDGLPQNTVQAIAQTPDGYLWIGTLGGLARFDGVHFKIYTTANAPELKYNRILNLAVDTQGKLWIGTEHGEIVTYKDGKFSLVIDGKINENRAILDLSSDETGTVWAGSLKKLFICREDSCQIIDYPSANQVRRDYQGNIWIRESNDLVLYSKRDFSNKQKIEENIKFIELKRGGGLILIKEKEIGFYEKGAYRKLKDLTTPILYLPVYDSQGNLWINDDSNLYKIEENEIKTYSLKQDDLKQLFFDKEGNLWAGRSLHGLLGLFPSHVQNIKLDTYYKNNSAKSIVETADGSVFISTDHGVFRWNNGYLEVSKDDFTSKNVFERGALLFDSRGILWNGTAVGLRTLQNGKVSFRKELSGGGNPVGSSLFEDSRHNIWFGCPGCGAVQTDGEKIIASYTSKDGLIGDDVRIIFEDKNNAMWFGTTSGLSKLQNGVFTNYSTENGLSNDYVRDIYEDQDGSLWIGTYGGGLNRLKDGKITHLTTANGLFDDIVSRILIDESDNFWMLGNRGIYSVNRQMLNDFAEGKSHAIYCRVFNSEDGMLTSEGNGGFQNAGVRTRDGKLWFPMLSGVVVIDPKQENSSPPHSIIEEVLIGNEPVGISDLLEIEANHREVEIIYTGISLHKSKQVQFRYKMDGLQNEWTEAGTRRVAYFPYLPSGEYRFQVMAMNANGVWSDDVAEIKIIVRPPFYQSWWFILLAVIIAYFVLYLIFQMQKRRFAHERRIHESFSQKLITTLESERKRIAVEIHDNLGQKLLIIKNWADYCLSKTAKTNKLHNQIVQIDETADEALNEIRSLAKVLTPYHLEKAGLTNTVKFMVKQVADSSKINFHLDIDNVDGVLSKESEINIYRIIQEAVNNIVKHSKASKANVILKRGENSLILKIHDNGIGFDKLKKDIQDRGIGLDGIRERAKMLGGNLIIKSVPKQLTQIILYIDLKTD